MCVCVRERESVCVCVCPCKNAHAFEWVCLSTFVCLYVQVVKREREKEIGNLGVGGMAEWRGAGVAVGPKSETAKLRITLS